MASHPLFRPHLMQGWSPDFIAKLTEDARDAGLIDEFPPVVTFDGNVTFDPYSLLPAWLHPRRSA